MNGQKRCWLTPPLVALLIIAGCGGTEDATSTTPRGEPTTTTISVTTTTIAAPATTAAPATSTTTTRSTTTTTADKRYVVGEPGVFPRPDTTTGPLPGSGGAGGSGCAPASTSLPDGIWFGFITARSDTSITFDLACFFFGPIAVEESVNDGVVDGGEIYIRNANPTLRTITVDSSVLVYEYFEDLTDTIEVPFDPVLFSHWPEDPSFPNLCPGESCGVWLFVNNGAVTEMLEQFFVP